VKSIYDNPLVLIESNIDDAKKMRHGPFEVNDWNCKLKCEDPRSWRANLEFDAFSVITDSSETQYFQVINIQTKIYITVDVLWKLKKIVFGSLITIDSQPDLEVFSKN